MLNLFTKNLQPLNNNHYENSHNPLPNHSHSYDVLGGGSFNRRRNMNRPNYITIEQTGLELDLLILSLGTQIATYKARMTASDDKTSYKVLIHNAEKLQMKLLNIKYPQVLS